MRNKLLLIGIALLSAVLALGAIACSDDNNDGDGDGAVATATEVMVDEPTATTETVDGNEEPSAFTVIATENPDLGLILTDPDGNTLYMFNNDANGESACTEGCADIWPPYIATLPLNPGEGVTGPLDIYERTDGSLQARYNGQPLYYYSGDEAPGDANGQGVADVWFVIELG